MGLAASKASLFFYRYRGNSSLKIARRFRGRSGKISMWDLWQDTNIKEKPWSSCGLCSCYPSRFWLYLVKWWPPKVEVWLMQQPRLLSSVLSLIWWKPMEKWIFKDKDRSKTLNQELHCGEENVLLMAHSLTNGAFLSQILLLIHPMWATQLLWMNQ